MIGYQLLKMNETLWKEQMTDSFMQNHQSALDSQREDNAIQELEDAGIYPVPDNDDYEPTDEEMLSSFGTKWHDGL